MVVPHRLRLPLQDRGLLPVRLPLWSLLPLRDRGAPTLTLSKYMEERDGGAPAIAESDGC